MPTILRVGPHRFLFDASDRAEPLHVHMEGGGGSAKFWLAPVRLHASRGLNRHELSRVSSIVAVHQERFVRAWNEYLVEGQRPVPSALAVRIGEDELAIDRSDGRFVTVPLAWYLRLVSGTVRGRRNWRLIGSGEGVHWPDLDEDISVEGVLAGRPSAESQGSFERWLASRSKPATKRMQPAHSSPRKSGVSRRART